MPTKQSVQSDKAASKPKSPFDTSGPSLFGAHLMLGRVAPNKKNGPLVTTTCQTQPLHVIRPRNQTATLIHSARAARKGNI
jgi:hypothetical protein